MPNPWTNLPTISYEFWSFSYCHHWWATQNLKKYTSRSNIIPKSVNRSCFFSLYCLLCCTMVLWLIYSMPIFSNKFASKLYLWGVSLTGWGTSSHRMLDLFGRWLLQSVLCVTVFPHHTITFLMYSFTTPGVFNLWSVRDPEAYTWVIMNTS